MEIHEHSSLRLAEKQDSLGVDGLPDLHIHLAIRLTADLLMFVDCRGSSVKKLSHSATAYTSADLTAASYPAQISTERPQGKILYEHLMNWTFVWLVGYAALLTIHAHSSTSTASSPFFISSRPLYSGSPLKRSLYYTIRFLLGKRFRSFSL